MLDPCMVALCHWFWSLFLLTGGSPGLGLPSAFTGAVCNQMWSHRGKNLLLRVHGPSQKRVAWPLQVGGELMSLGDLFMSEERMERETGRWISAHCTITQTKWSKLVRLSLSYWVNLLHGITLLTAPCLVLGCWNLFVMCEHIVHVQIKSSLVKIKRTTDIYKVAIVSFYCGEDGAELLGKLFICHLFYVPTHTYGHELRARDWKDKISGITFRMCLYCSFSLFAYAVHRFE